MALTLQDKLALMMTSAGSQRQLAALVGVSHQRIGRWLTIGQTLPDGTPSRVQAPTDPGILAAVEQAYAMHADVSRAQAKRDRIPFDANAPVFAQRLAHPDGRPGKRVIIEHTHRMRDELRNKVIARAQKTKRYYAVSTRSLVNLKRYHKQADARFATGNIEFTRNKRRVLERKMIAEELKDNAQTIKERDGVYLKPIFTAYTSMDHRFPSELVTGEQDYKLRTRHQAATGEKGTAYADQILFQLDSTTDNQGSGDAKSKTKRDKARSDKSGTGRTTRRKR